MKPILEIEINLLRDGEKKWLLNMATVKNDKDEEKPKKNVEKEEKKYTGGVFECSNCNLKEKYHYYGKKPPFARYFTFQEDAYIARDLFSPKDEMLFLLLGGKCKMCEKPVCQKQECSLFYNHRYCISCIKSNMQEFPAEITKLTEKP